MGDKPNTNLEVFDISNVQKMGFGHIDLNNDGVISDGDSIIVPLKVDHSANPEMVLIPYDETHGPLLSEFLMYDRAEYGEESLEIPAGPAKAYAEWEIGSDGRFDYFTKLRFGDTDIALELAKQKIVAAKK